MSLPDPSMPSGSSGASSSDFGLGLFRQEVLSSKENAWLGKMSLAVPVSFRVFSVSASMLLALIGALMYFGTYTVTETAHGLILPVTGVTEVSSVTNGTITAMRVTEGETVVRGAVLLSVRRNVDDAVTELTSPSGGTIFSVNRHVGQSVSTSEPVIAIAPNESLVVIAMVSPVVKAQVRTGTPVQMELAGLKKRARGRLGGRLKMISVAPLNTDTQNLASGLHYRAVIEIDSSASTTSMLKREQLLGQAAEIRIPVTKRRLYQWVLDPMQSLFDL